METFFRGIIRFRYLVIVLILTCTGLAWIQLQSLRFEGDADAFLPENDPVMSYNDVVEDRFGIRDLIIVGVINKNPEENGVFNPRTLTTIKELSEKIALLPGVKAIRDEDVASVATLNNITGTIDGMTVEPFMQTVPQSSDQLAALKRSLFHNAIFVNWLVSEDSTGMLITAKMEPGEGTAEGTAKRIAIYTSIRDMVEEKKATGAPEDFHIAGQGALEVTIEEDMRIDVEQFVPLVLLVVLVTLYSTYRSVRGVLLPLAVVIVSVIWTMGIMAALGVPMYSISTLMPVILMAIGVADGIHILSRYYDEVLAHPDTSSSEAVLVAMHEMWQPVVFTSLTTAAGFMSFLTSNIVPIRYFGLFTALGVVAAMVFSITFFPAALSLFAPKISPSLRRQMDRGHGLEAAGWAASFLSRIGLRVARRPLVVWLSTAAVVGVSLIGAQRIIVDSSFIQMTDPTSPIRIADEVLRETFQGTLPIYVAIEGQRPDLLKDPQLLRQLDRLQAVAEQDPIVGGSLSLAEYIKRMHRVMNEDRPEMEVIPDSQELVAQYLLLYSFSGDPDDFDEVTDYDYQHANLSLYLRSDRTQEIERVVQIVRNFAVQEFGLPEESTSFNSGAHDPLPVRFGRWLAGMTPTLISWETDRGFRIGIAGNGYLVVRFNELIVAGQLSSLVFSLGAVFLLSALMFRSWVAGLINIIPISLVMIFSFGLIGLLGIPLEIGKSLMASMVIGIGVDYTIHFLNKYRVKVRDGLQDAEQITAATMATSGKAIFFNAVVVVGGFLVFLTSKFPPNFELGAMLALNMIACLIVSMTVLPTILNVFRPRFVYGEERTPEIGNAA